MKKVLLIAFSLILLHFFGAAQKYDYDRVSPAFIGFSLGHTWHTTDVLNIKNRFPIGAGINLGGTFNHNYGTIFSYDLRLRFIGGSWYGQDQIPTTEIENNSAVYSLYKPIGMAVQNFRTKQRDLDLELAIHLNRLKERTGIDPYIFGGIGVHWTSTRGDLKDGTGKIYPYDEKPTGSIINQEYTTFLDKNYNGEKYDDIFEINWQPSLGFGIGYYFTSNFSIGLEHRTTFTRNDYFDGTIVTQNGTPSKYKNDLYHYTSFYMKFYFNRIRGKYQDESYVRPGSSVPPPGTNRPSKPETSQPGTKPNNDTGTQQSVKRPPIVQFTNPPKSPTQSPNVEYAIQAHVQFVNTAENLIFTQNGKDINSFSFDVSNGIFRSNVVLQDGENHFNLTGVNQDGVHSDQTTLIYEKKKHDFPPIVTIVDPAISPHKVKSSTYTIRAKIENISARNQLSVKLNGKTVKNYNFTPTGNFNFSTTVELNEGENLFKIVGTNNAGKDSDQVTLVFEKRPTIDTGTPPFVNYTMPGMSPYSTTNPVETVVATVQYVSQKQQIEVRVNNKKHTDFTFDFLTKKVQFNAELAKGTNIIYVKGTNDYGSNYKETKIVYREPAKPEVGNAPEVKIIVPTNNPSVTYKLNDDIVADVNHVDTKQQITVEVNGKNFTNFTYNNSTKKVNLNVNLLDGDNTIKITATNNFGSDFDQTVITRKKLSVPDKTPGNPQRPEKGEAPEVKITTPNKNPYTTFLLEENIVASVKNVDSKNQIEVKVNNKSISNFTFNSTTKLVLFTTPLNRGTNIIKVSATNNFGSDSDEIQIISRELTTPGPPPEVTITKPSSSPYSTFMANEIIEATVKNVDSKEQIQVLINNYSYTDFNYSQNEQKVSFTITLTPGAHNIIVKATNQTGTASDNVQIIYRPETSSPETNKPPVINFISPSNNNSTVSESSYTFKASVENMLLKKDIELKLNNVTVNPNNFEFNAGSKMVTFTGNLQEGSNQLQIHAVNTFGSASKSISITRTPSNNESNNPPCNQHPNILYDTIQGTNYSVSIADIPVLGNLVNIQKRNQITVFLNGKKMTDFVFNLLTKRFEHKLTLKEGENVYLIRLANDCSTVDKQLIFNYQATSSGKTNQRKPAIQSSPNKKEDGKKGQIKTPEINIQTPGREIQDSPNREEGQRNIRNQ